MLVVPYSHDQPDHAYRLKKLGVARSIARQKYIAQGVAREIAQLLSDRSYAARASEIATRVLVEHGANTACDLLERLLGKQARQATVA